MEQNPYQPPNTEPPDIDAPAVRHNLIRMKYLLRVTYGSLLVASCAGFFQFGLRASGQTLLGWVALVIFVFSGLISVFANLYLFALSVVGCWKDYASFVYLVASLVLPSLFALALYMRSF
jgi:hypothetical protein